MTPGGTVDAFLRELARRGVALSADGDALRVRAPKGTLSNGDRDRLRDEKAAILAHLRGDASSDGEPDDAPFPLTDIQEAYLIGRNAELELGRVGCHAYREFEMAGLDLDRLERAWNAVLARHEMLRVVMTEDGRQRILHAVPWYRIDRLDLREAADPERELADRREARSHHVFKPGEWPLFDIRASLLPDCIRLSVGIDLLVADAAALITLFRDWSALYADSDRVLPPLNASFRDHARRRQMPSPVDRAYWEARLGSFPPAPDLPRLPLAGPPRFSRRSLAVAAAEWGELKRRAAAGGLTPSALLMAVYADILAAWSRRARFAVVVTRFAAPAEMQGVVGDFTETVLLEIDSTPARFLDRAKGLQARLLADLDHPTMSGVAVLRALRRQRPDFEPVAAVFTSTVGHPALDPAAPSPLAWLGETVYAITQTPQVAIDHHVMEQEGGLVASFDAVEALFPAGVLDAMMAAYARLVAALAAGEGWDGSVADAQPPLSRAPLLPAAPAALLHEAVARQAALAPERAAVIAPDLTLDHRTLDRAAAHLAAQISERLGSPETARDRLVAITWPKGWRQIVAALAALKAGAAYLPVDPALPAERRHYLIAQGEALVLPDDAPELALRAAREQPPPALPPVDDPRRLAYVIYTSGSTGVPKGVMIEHRAAWATIAEVNRRWSLNADDRVLGLSSLSFDLSVWDIFGPLSVGGALVLPPSEAVRDPAAWASLLCHHRVTVWNSVPALLALLLEHGLPLGHSLRLALLSGDWVPLPLVRQLREIAPAVRLVALGGATEAAIWSNAHEIGDTLDPAWPSIPYGTPLAGQMLHIVNERCEACPDWVTGEIEIAGAGLARGYWHDEALTAARFVMRGGERRYRTGDLGRFRPYGPDSAPTPIEFLGREDFQVKVQGHRIELGEIEAVLARHPDVAQAVATVVPASGSTVLHAFVVPRAEAWERTRLLLERRGLRRLPEVPRLPLPHRPPADSYERRSVRRFLPDAVALAALAPLLHAAVEDRLVVRLLARHVAGLEPGLWGYEPAPGGLRRLADRDVVIPDAGTAQIAAGAAFLILLDAPPGMSRREALLQAGTAGQRLMQSATTAGLGLCPIGVLRLAGAPVLHAFAGGCPAAETAGIDLAGALREHCAAVLPSWMVPRQVHLVAALPLGANGKLDRAALRPPGEPASAQTTGDGDALRQRVGAIVAEILGEPVEPFHKLFDCGATSLHIVRLQRALADELDSPLGVIDLFRLPTVAALAAALAGEVAASPAAVGAARAARRRQLAQARR
ncbi:MAG: amino acid adenylation domain-containing protein [Thiohalocapsa sp.]